VKFCQSFSRTECFGEVAATSLDEVEKRDLEAAALERNFNERHLIWFSLELEEGEVMDILSNLYAERLGDLFRRQNLMDFLSTLSPASFVFTLHYAWPGNGYQEWSGQPVVYDPSAQKIFVGGSHYRGAED